MSNDQTPSIGETFGMMRQSMGAIPEAIQKAAAVDESLVYEHWRSRGYAMPSEKPALDEETRTLINLAAALAASSPICIKAMANRAKVQGIPAEKLLETLRIVRYTLATRAIQDAVPLFSSLQGDESSRPKPVGRRGAAVTNG
jgi:alkylhydroperoxidase/carboxymuconolactone decarboxylase family protein YurZ